MGSMRQPSPLPRLVRFGLAALLGGALVVESRAADPPPLTEFRGACYCRADGRLNCTGDLTLSVCTRRCAEELCDDWFWKERLPCGNWGYGG